MVNTLKDKEILIIAEKTLSKYKLCDHCLGRLFAKIEKGVLNKKRGEIIRSQIKNSKITKVNDCFLCSGLINEIPHFANLIAEALDEYEYDTFLIGSKIDEDILEKEKEIIDFSKSEYSEAIKNEINREIGKILETKLNKEVDFKNPTIMVIIDTAFDTINLQITSLYLYGRYKKFKRNIPQTKWFCKICKGKGCSRCNYSGKLYNTSVEELVSKKILDASQGDNEAFHGCGREDIDVLMLGNGRPFVLEIKDPIIRKIDLQKIEDAINKENKEKIAITNIRFSDHDEITRIKKAEFKKTYRIVFESEKLINNEKLIKATQSLQGKSIGQFTPSRVAHRRANMVREKHIYMCNIESVDGSMAILTLEAESGTYIKELVSGDDGKTKPNISEMIGAPCKVTELDVIEIKGE